MAIAGFLESYVFGPSGFWTMAPLCYAAKFDPFLSLDCARLEGEEGIKFRRLATLQGQGRWQGQGEGQGQEGELGGGVQQ